MNTTIKPRCPSALLAASTAMLLGATAVSAHAGPCGFDCLIEPRQMVELRIPVEGLIAQVHVERGASVCKGQVLVSLSRALQRANLDLAKHRAEMTGRIASARNRVDFAKRKVERTQPLIADNFISTQARDEAETEMNLAESELKDALEKQRAAQLELRRAAEQGRSG